MLFQALYHAFLVGSQQRKVRVGPSSWDSAAAEPFPCDGLTFTFFPLRANVNASSRISSSSVPMRYTSCGTSQCSDAHKRNDYSDSVELIQGA